MADDLLTRSWRKVANRVAVHDGRTLDAFDELDTGLHHAPLQTWFAERFRKIAGANVHKFYGGALALAMMVVEADRATRLEHPPPIEGEWTRDQLWQQRADRHAEAQDWPPEVPTPECWRKSPLAAMVGREPLDNEEDLRWHISLSHAERVPNWQELAASAHELRPGVPFCVGVPIRSQWFNYSEATLHLWELKDENLLAQWRAGGRGDEPT